MNTYSRIQQHGKMERGGKLKQCRFKMREYWGVLWHTREEHIERYEVNCYYCIAPQWRWWWCWWWLRGYIHIWTYKKKVGITWLSCAVCIQCRANTTVYTRYEAFFRYCCSHYSLTYVCLMSQQQYLSIVFHIYTPCVYLYWQYIIYFSLFRMSNFTSHRTWMDGWKFSMEIEEEWKERSLPPVCACCLSSSAHKRKKNYIAHTKIIYMKKYTSPAVSIVTWTNIVGISIDVASYSS